MNLCKLPTEAFFREELGACVSCTYGIYVSVGLVFTGVGGGGGGAIFS